jgi:hypothetical protein
MSLGHQLFLMMLTATYDGRWSHKAYQKCGWLLVAVAGNEPRRVPLQELGSHLQRAAILHDVFGHMVVTTGKAKVRASYQ